MKTTPSCSTDATPKLSVPPSLPLAPLVVTGKSVQSETDEIGATGFSGVRHAPTESGPVRKTSSVVKLRCGCVVQTDDPTFRFTKYNGPEISFPLSEEDAAKLANCNAVSPFVATNPRVLVKPTDLDPPTHPGHSGYWSELEKVIDIQIARKTGGSVQDLLGERTPKIFEGYSLEQAAEAVHTDLPSDWPTKLLKQFLAEGAKFDASVVPHLSQADFVNTIVTTTGVLGMATAAVSPSAFACKWHEGRARPEEAVFAVAKDQLDGAPNKLRTKIKALQLASAEAFTAYPEGAPRHPSWPAMHSAASISSMVLAVLFDLDPGQLQESRNMDYAVSTFRTVAGVHFETDNLAGLKIGQKAIEAWLPDFLAQYAGADPEKVRAKIEKIRYDWDTHPPLVAPKPC